MLREVNAAFLHRTGKGHTVDGKSVKPKDLQEILAKDHWIVETIGRAQNTWKTTHNNKPLPANLLKAEDSGKLLDLVGAIQGIERGQFSSGESKR